jgi:hypothetical protein
VKMWNSPGSEEFSMVNFCEHGDEISGFINVGSLFDQLDDYQLMLRLCFMQLIDGRPVPRILVSIPVFVMGKSWV